MIKEETRKDLRGLVPIISRRLLQGMPRRIFLSSIVLLRSLVNVQFEKYNTLGECPDVNRSVMDL